MAGGLSVSDANKVIDIIVSTLEVYMHPLSVDYPYDITQ